jgi:hypothetical protein
MIAMVGGFPPRHISLTEEPWHPLPGLILERATPLEQANRYGLRPFAPVTDVNEHLLTVGDRPPTMDRGNT